jgi:integrase
MTPLRLRMIETMQLRGLAPRTQESYLSAVRQLALHYGKSPDLITEDELRQYFLFLIVDRQLAPNSTNVALNAVKFFYTYTLRRPWPLRDLVRPPLPQKLPVVLTPEEIWRIIAQVRRPDYSVCLSVIAACGLRLLEGVDLQVTQIDSARNQLLIRSGKGNKDRAVPLPSRTLSLLRALAAAPQPDLAVSHHPARRPAPRHCGHGRKRPSEGFPQGAIGRRRDQTRHHPLAAPFLGHPPPRKRCERARGAAVDGPHLADHHRDLHPPDPADRAACRQGA